MEIPYIVNARKDTGLNNSKIAIWLFLASEVMLFGGLFSSYIFLRVFADYPWPERALPVLPGLINTFILIASSVTVVFAWAGLKLRKWNMFRANMAFTILCAAVFMVLKADEYNKKLHHHASQTEDYAWLEGHLDKDHPNQYTIEADTINFSVESTASNYLDAIITQNADYPRAYFVEKLYEKINSGDLSEVAKNSYKEYIELSKDVLPKKIDKASKVVVDLLEEAHALPTIPTLAEPYKIRTIEAGKFTETVLYSAGTELSPEVLAVANDEFIRARTHNQELRTQLLKDAWNEIRDVDKHPELADIADLESKVKSAVTKAHNALIDKAEENNEFLIANGNMMFNSKGAEFSLNTGWGRISDSTIGAKYSNVSLLDGTVLSGTAGDSSIVYHYVDGIDFRHLVLKAEAKGLNAEELIERSPILNIHDHGGHHGGADIREIWEAHKVWRGFLAADLLTQDDWLTGEGRVPTEVDLYRVTWHQMVAYDKLKKEMVVAKKISANAPLKDAITAENWMRINGELKPSMLNDVKSKLPEEIIATFPHHVSIERDEVRFDSVFSPKMNNYYAIYFTITGLHGLHVIGGAIVLGYYLFFGRKMYLSNPEWLANRVEVGGLFWHFVDLVWILVFPLFYLM
ncbi:cytochrome c oxidase subunit 3 [Rubritalea profundi]|uniref:Heme-copper oxidase subunit III family profile domain-containing protein n=1 Tax=Rubritalea profundi TaxID=1658618 RepID=A0A2S7U470_9BACT|nr:cytochrome c oxidase subunit 3 [Rubritalea profundi]PQJ28953.1 hypothetical protein BSZ32_10935 [Rubritalea profundi]